MHARTRIASAIKLEYKLFIRQNASRISQTCKKKIQTALTKHKKNAPRGARHLHRQDPIRPFPLRVGADTSFAPSGWETRVSFWGNHEGRKAVILQTYEILCEPRALSKVNRAVQAPQRDGVNLSTSGRAKHVQHGMATWLAFSPTTEITPIE